MISRFSQQLLCIHHLWMHVPMYITSRLHIKTLQAIGGARSGEEAVRSAFINVDQAGVGSLTQQQFEAALKQAGVNLTRHQMISLHRRLAKDGKVQVVDILQVLT